MPDSLKRPMLFTGGVVVSYLWYLVYSDLLAAVVILVGAAVGWLVSLFRKPDHPASHLFIGGIIALVLVGATLRIAATVEGGYDGSIIFGLVSKGAFLSAGIALMFASISRKPIEAILPDNDTDLEGSTAD